MGENDEYILIDIIELHYDEVGHDELNYGSSEQSEDHELEMVIDLVFRGEKHAAQCKSENDSAAEEELADNLTSRHYNNN